jgi:hypothetical protein
MIAVVGGSQQKSPSWLVGAAQSKELHGSQDTAYADVVAPPQVFDRQNRSPDDSPDMGADGESTEDAEKAEQVRLSYAAAEKNAPIKLRLYMLLEDVESQQGPNAVSGVILIAIIVSLVLFILETEQRLSVEYAVAFFWSDVIITGIFLLEYFVRLWICNVLGTDTRLRFIFRFSNVCDFVAILPLFLENMPGIGQGGRVFRAFRAIRLSRLMRLLRMKKHASAGVRTGVKVVVDTLVSSRQALGVLAFVSTVGVLLFSSAIFFAEKASCPNVEAFSEEVRIAYQEGCRTMGLSGGWHKHGLCCDARSVAMNFPSIPDCLWWTIVTMTTVGFGDVYPLTPQGQFVAWITMLFGILLIALPVAIVGSRFQEVYTSQRTSETMGHPALDLRRELARECMLLQHLIDQPGDMPRLCAQVQGRISGIQETGSLDDGRGKSSVKKLRDCLQQLVDLEPRLREKAEPVTRGMVRLDKQERIVKNLERKEQALHSHVEELFAEILGLYEKIAAFPEATIEVREDLKPLFQGLSPSRTQK